MIEYKPWSRLELAKSIEKYKNGYFSILDIEVSGQCNFNCMYCDSPDRKEKCRIDIDSIERMLSTGAFDWIFICGLGEPTAGKNYRFLIGILKLCKKYHVKCSVFTNVSICNEELIQYIEDDILHILFKYDSTDFRLNANVYGISSTNARSQYINIQTLMQYVHCENNLTNIGASIVPTKLNLHEIPKLVEGCIKHNVYPLIAELENCGRGQAYYSALSLSVEEIQGLKHTIEEIIGEEYHIPICPAVISGIHISSKSTIVVDEISGLTCPWFWLEQPQLHEISKFDFQTDINEIESSMICFRKQKLDKIKALQTESINKNLERFGGCGGDTKKLLDIYIQVQESLGEGKL